jgi:DNA polymerase eta
MSVEHPKARVVRSAPEGSRYTYRDLYGLNDAATSYRLPLAVIGHVDLNAFFAQVEQMRLGLTRNDPVVCVQWSLLIAVSYAARKYGINRMDSVTTARAKCPHVVLAHAAVFHKGSAHWAYEAGLPSQANYKVSLDPYRRESRKIILIFNQECDMVEKASVDESYLDVGRMVYARLERNFPQWRRGDDLDARLPPVPAGLEMELYGETEEEPTISDWDDVCMCIGSQLIYHVRLEVYKVLGYTTSGGVGRNKVVAKLAGGLHKPDNQAVIFNRSLGPFLNRFELTDIGGMGGKTGSDVLAKLGIHKAAEADPPQSTITRIRRLEFDEVKAALGDDLATKVYHLVRGEHPTALTLKLEVKSMMSRKNFQIKAVNNLRDAYDWIKVFSGDLHHRLIEQDDESMNVLVLQQDTSRPTIRRPKTVSLLFGTMQYQSHSKQLPIPVVQSLEKLQTLIEQTALRLLKELLDSFGGSKDLNGGLKMADVKTDEITTDIAILGCTSMALTISNFTKTSNSNLIDSFGRSSDPRQYEKDFMLYQRSRPATDHTERSILQQLRAATVPDPLATGVCARCHELVAPAEMALHADFHVAMDLSRKINGEPVDAPSFKGASCKESEPSYARAGDTSPGAKLGLARKTKKRKTDKGQSKLPWGT